jgi:LmbE family N-acetylglucosaminyl deacetylase
MSQSSFSRNCFMVHTFSRMLRHVFLIGIVCAAGAAGAQGQPAPRTILAIGAHAGDMELTTGALLLKQHKAGDRIVILHMTLGEGGNPRMSPTAYGAQKRREALAVDSALGAQAMFAPYKDGELPDDEAVRLYIRTIRAPAPSFRMLSFSPRSKESPRERRRTVEFAASGTRTTGRMPKIFSRTSI